MWLRGVCMCVCVCVRGGRDGGSAPAQSSSCITVTSKRRRLWRGQRAAQGSATLLSSAAGTLPYRAAGAQRKGRVAVIGSTCGSLFEGLTGADGLTRLCIRLERLCVCVGMFGCWTAGLHVIDLVGMWRQVNAGNVLMIDNVILDARLSNQQQALSVKHVF